MIPELNAVIYFARVDVARCDFRNVATDNERDDTARDNAAQHQNQRDTVFGMSVEEGLTSIARFSASRIAHSSCNGAVFLNE